MMDLRNTAVACVAVGKWYPRGLERLDQSLNRIHYPGKKLFWENEYPSGSPTHQDVPYAFKAYALQEAVNQGLDAVLWLDASCWAVTKIDAIFQVAEERKIACWLDGYWMGQWCADHALEKLGVTREESFTIPIITGRINCMDLRTEVGRGLAQYQLKHAKLGTYIGAWTNENQQVSTDDRVTGHRHDMPSLSLYTHQHEIKPVNFNREQPQYYQMRQGERWPGTCIVHEGL